MRVVRILTSTLCLLVLLPAHAREIVGHAIVRDDGSLRIRERVIRHHGIYLPETERQCREWIRPVRCADRAVLQLDFKVQGFIHCVTLHENEDSSLEGTCYVDRTRFREGEDLAAYLIRYGWAVALPNAPFKYHALEKIARSRGFGVWGFRVDSIIGGQ